MRRRLVQLLVPLAAPIVTVWAAWQRQRVRRRGRPLTPAQRRVAAAVGVAHPERVRLLVAERVPLPGGPALDALAHRLGLPGHDVDGLTLGDAIVVRAGTLTDELLAHECRHVQQCEAAGSLRRFLAAYLAQVARHGYRKAPFEVDARRAAAWHDPAGGPLPPAG